MVVRAIARDGVVGSNINFLSNYGGIASKYSCVSPLGRASFRVVIAGIASIFFAILSIVFFVIRYGKVETNENGEMVEEEINSTFKYTIAPILAFVSLVICLVCGGLWIYQYLFCYLKQYNNWQKEIPASALAQLYTTRAVENVLAATGHRGRR